MSVAWLLACAVGQPDLCGHHSRQGSQWVFLTLSPVERWPLSRAHLTASFASRKSNSWPLVPGKGLGCSFNPVECHNLHWDREKNRKAITKRKSTHQESHSWPLLKILLLRNARNQALGVEDSLSVHDCFCAACSLACDGITS